VRAEEEREGGRKGKSRRVQRKRERLRLLLITLGFSAFKITLSPFLTHLPSNNMTVWKCGAPKD
jgi:hypothetical protein